MRDRGGLEKSISAWTRGQPRAGPSWSPLPPRPAAFQPSRRDRVVIEQVHGRTAEEFTLDAAGRKSSLPWRRFYRLRRAGVLKTVALVDRTLHPSVESVTRVRVNWSSHRSGELEGLLADDPWVTQAALVTGPVDFVVYSAHPDEYAALAWARHLRTHPAVAALQIDRVRQKLNRFSPVEILLPPLQERRRAATHRTGRPNPVR